jgi:hypothetical protein
MENSLSTRANASYICGKYVDDILCGTVGRLVTPIPKAEFVMISPLLPRGRGGGDLRQEIIFSRGACRTRWGSATSATLRRGPTVSMGEGESGGGTRDEPKGGFRGADVFGVKQLLISGVSGVKQLLISGVTGVKELLSEGERHGSVW